MIDKQDFIRFVENVKPKTLESAIIIVTSDNNVSYYIEGNPVKLAASIGLVAKEDQDFMSLLEVAASCYEEKNND